MKIWKKPNKHTHTQTNNNNKTTLKNPKQSNKLKRNLSSFVSVQQWNICWTEPSSEIGKNAKISCNGKKIMLTSTTILKKNQLTQVKDQNHLWLSNGSSFSVLNWQ